MCRAEATASGEYSAPAGMVAAMGHARSLFPRAAAASIASHLIWFCWRGRLRRFSLGNPLAGLGGQPCAFGRERLQVDGQVRWRRACPDRAPVPTARIVAGVASAPAEPGGRRAGCGARCGPQWAADNSRLAASVALLSSSSSATTPTRAASAYRTQIGQC